MNFLYPIALFGLMGIGIPILIHLLSKNKREEIFFGSLQFLVPSESPSARSIFLTQWVLLLIRIILIGLIVMTVAKPIFDKGNDQPLVFIEEAVLQDSAYSELVNALTKNSFIPFQIDKIQDHKSFVSYNSFIEYINDLGDSVVVYSTSKIRDFRGSAVPVDARVDWKVLPIRNWQENKDTVVFKDEVVGLTWKNGEGFSEVTKQPITEIKYYIDTLKFFVGSKQKSKKTLYDFKNIIENLDDEWPLTIDFTSKKKDADWLVMIDTLIFGPTSAGRIIWDTEIGRLDLIKLSDKVWKVNGGLTRENLLRSNFIMTLSKIGIESIIPIAENDENSYRPILKNNLPNNTMERTRLQMAGNQYPWMWILVMIFVVIERWYAYKVN